MSDFTLWQEILWGWIILTIAPKLIVIPVWRWMWGAVKDTERQDAIDAAWLAGLGGGGSGGGTDRHPRSRRPWSRGPGRGPRDGGGSAARLRPRGPQRVEARARRVPIVPAR
ncbi:MAG: hypothetical protein ACO3KD_03960 [Gaiellales bacterium]